MKYSHFEYSGKVDADTVAAAQQAISGLDAKDDSDAIGIVSAAIWEEAGWGSCKECEQHLYDHFCPVVAA